VVPLPGSLCVRARRARRRSPPADQIVDCDPAQLRIGDRVKAVFEKVDDEVTLLCFTPDEAR
jgi:hypothetical protein